MVTKQNIYHPLDVDLNQLHSLLSGAECFDDEYTAADLSSEILDEYFQTPLHLAVARNDVSSIRALLGAVPVSRWRMGLRRIARGRPAHRLQL